jgi:hypothetical protein
VTDVLANEIVACDADDMIAPCISEPMQDLRHPQSNGRLSGAGIAREAHVQGGWFRLEPELTPRAFNK